MCFGEQLGKDPDTMWCRSGLLSLHNSNCEFWSQCVKQCSLQLLTRNPDCNIIHNAIFIHSHVILLNVTLPTFRWSPTASPTLRTHRQAPASVRMSQRQMSSANDSALYNKMAATDRKDHLSFAALVADISTALHCWADLWEKLMMWHGRTNLDWFVHTSEVWNTPLLLTIVYGGI